MKKSLPLIISILLLLGVGVIVVTRNAQFNPLTRDISTKTILPDQPVVSPYAANHANILTSWFRAGTPAGQGDRGTSNVDSAWYANWAAHLGGADTGNLPLARPGKDNLFYFALPCPDYNDDTRSLLSDHIALGRQAGLAIPDVLSSNQSAFKNLWIQVRYGDKTVYAQWEDVGPLGPKDTQDCNYVLGSARPAQEKSKAIDSALDLSPTAFGYLESNLRQGIIKTSWAFVPAEAVPDGPWKTTVTTSGPDR